MRRVLVGVKSLQRAHIYLIKYIHLILKYKKIYCKFSKIIKLLCIHNISLHKFVIEVKTKKYKSFMITDFLRKCFDKSHSFLVIVELLVLDCPIRLSEKFWQILVLKLSKDFLNFLIFFYF